MIQNFGSLLVIAYSLKSEYIATDLAGQVINLEPSLENCKTSVTSIVFLRLKELCGKNEKKEKSTLPFYITPQTPVQMNESMREINPQYKNTNIKTKIVGNKVLFPKVNVFREKVKTLRANDLLFVEETLDEIDDVLSDSIHEDDNVFTADT